MRTTLLPLLALAACAAHPDIAHVTGEAAGALIEAGTVPLDVRTGAEHRRGHPPGAINASYLGWNFRAKVADIPRETPLLVVCETGHRSPRAARLLVSYGFTDVTHLDGGMRSWRAAGLPVEE